MGFFIVQLVLQFFSRKIFLEYLGTEILGLNTTAMNLLQFLNLAELGISAGVSFSLYRPLHDNDRVTINEIVALQGKLYSMVGRFIIVGAVILMCFFPLIFEKITIPLWYAYASFGVLLFSALLGYFVNFRQILLTANQQDYKVQYTFRATMLVKVLAQMGAVYYFKNGYDWWLILEAVFALIASVVLHVITMRTFPWLSRVQMTFKELRKKYPELTLKIKQLFFHKIAGFALTQSAPLIIYAYTSLTVVALYGNYLIVINGLQALLSSFFNSINAGIGDLVAEGDGKRQLSVFFELMSMRFFIIVVICFCSWVLAPEFIKVWIGEKYLLDSTTLLLMLLTLYVNTFRLSVDSYIMAFGLFRDIWAPVAETALNIGLSILLGYFYGLNGVLCGVLLSLLIIVVCWRPYFLFREKFPGSLKRYIFVYFRHILAAAASIAGFYLLYPFFDFRAADFAVLAVKGLIVFTVYAALLVMTMIIFKTDILVFFTRLLKRFR